MTQPETAGRIAHRRVRLRDRGNPRATVLYLYSEVAMLAIRLPHSIEERLEKLARRTGRTKSYYAREAILEHLDDLEDAYLALRRLKEPAKTYSAKEVKRAFGL